ncbi:response regulator [Peribacillus kribbensis]|uniref:response regulator n=1 Tax=Peribacillus kribbensis TaxID=356658 RepID=UPI001FE1CC24|nr:response regulator [Peribacillus kribbensis]
MLIVDDEVLERKALTKFISSSDEEVEVIGEAPNGRKAIELAKNHSPDIIFMDIKMPGIDGVQAVKEIKKFSSSIRFIMVSAFNTFEYAKEVMRLGVKEYILKPSSRQDILDSLKRAAGEILEERRIEEEHRHLKENLTHAVSLVQKEWITSLLVNQVQDISFDEWGQLLGLEVAHGYIGVFAIQPLNGKNPSENEVQKWYMWLRDALKTAARNEEIMAGSLNDLKMPVLFLCKAQLKRSQIKTSAQNIHITLPGLFKAQFPNARLHIGIGSPYNEARELHLSYHEAVSAMENGSIASSQKAARANPLDAEKKLLESIQQGDTVQVMADLGVYVENLHNEEEGIGFKKSFEELFVLISRMLHDFGITSQTPPAFVESETPIKIIEKSKLYLLTAVQQVQTFRMNHAGGILYKAKEFIEKHFSESITLEQVAEYVELSPFYFSKLFKERFGMTFIDYVTDIRINKAKKEMTDPGKSMKEICFSVGYKDPNYFSRVFKKMTGHSPSEFRKSVLPANTASEVNLS